LPNGTDLSKIVEKRGWAVPELGPASTGDHNSEIWHYLPSEKTPHVGKKLLRHIPYQGWRIDSYATFP